MAVIAVPDADYADVFLVAGGGSHSAEAWARAAFEPASPWDGRQVVWRQVLQLRLGPLDDPERVAGWTVAERTDRRLVLVADSWQISARLDFEAGPAGAQVATRVSFRHPTGRLVWLAVGPLHRRAVPAILAAARRRLGSQRTEPTPGR